MKTENEQIKELFQGGLVPISIEVKLIAELVNKWGNKMDQWAIILNGVHSDSDKMLIPTIHTFDYWTGTGHRVLKRVKGMRYIKAQKNYKELYGAQLLPVPTYADVLYSLLMDMTDDYPDFKEWADCFGYDNDSIKALNTFNACKENTRKLKECLNDGIIEKIKVILEDY